MASRGFTGGGDFQLPARDIDNDAPAQMRQEWVDHAFLVSERVAENLRPEHLYRIIGQSLGIQVSGNPYGGPRYAAGRDLSRAEWRRVYDVVLRVGIESSHHGAHGEYQAGVNRLFAVYGIAWDLDDQNRLVRVLPPPVAAQIQSVIEELSDPRFAAAMALFQAARDAYDDRPRRDRDACSNAFDAVESVAKEKFQMPNATFGAVLQHIGQAQVQPADVIAVLREINDLRNHNFGHGMVAPFAFTGAQVDFIYTICAGAILLLARTP